MTIRTVLSVGHKQYNLTEQVYPSSVPLNSSAILYISYVNMLQVKDQKSLNINQYTLIGHTDTYMSNTEIVDILMKYQVQYPLNINETKTMSTNSSMIKQRIAF